MTNKHFPLPPTLTRAPAHLVLDPRNSDRCQLATPPHISSMPLRRVACRLLTSVLSSHSAQLSRKLRTVSLKALNPMS